MSRIRIAHGMNERTDIFFDTSPVFRLDAAAAGPGHQGVRVVRYRGAAKSGWAWGQQYLQNGVAVIDAPMGKGRVLLFGPEIMKRAQPHGTFKFLFNGIYSPSRGHKAHACLTSDCSRSSRSRSSSARNQLPLLRIRSAFPSCWRNSRCRPSAWR